MNKTLSNFFRIGIPLCFLLVIAFLYLENFRYKKKFLQLDEEVNFLLKKISSNQKRNLDDISILRELIDTKAKTSTEETKIDLQSIQKTQDEGIIVDDMDQEYLKSAEEAEVRLENEFNSNAIDSFWAQDHEQKFWNNYQKWSHIILQSESSQPHFSLDSVQCKSTMCHMVVHYDKSYPILDTQREVIALLHTVDSCGFTSVAYDEATAGHEWYLECNR